MEIFYFFLLFLDEACDCGFKEDCEKLGDSCCYPADTPEKYLRCTLKPGKQCSPSQGPCCNGEICKFKPSTVECSSEVDCTEAQNCNGNSAQCPKPKSKPDNSKLYHMNRILNKIIIFIFYVYNYNFKSNYSLKESFNKFPE